MKLRFLFIYVYKFLCLFFVLTMLVPFLINIGTMLSSVSSFVITLPVFLMLLQGILGRIYLFQLERGKHSGIHSWVKINTWFVTVFSLLSCISFIYFIYHPELIFRKIQHDFFQKISETSFLTALYIGLFYCSGYFLFSLSSFVLLRLEPTLPQQITS